MLPVAWCGNNRPPRTAPTSEYIKPKPTRITKVNTSEARSGLRSSSTAACETGGAYEVDVANVISEPHCHEGKVDELDPGERKQHATDAVDQHVPAQQRHRAGGLEVHAGQGQRNQRRDDDRVEDQR